METIIAFLILVGFLIWFHELGHFLFAKLFNVKVEVFSVGFGPPVVSKKVGETVYQIAAIPLGGYVKLYGEEANINDPRAFSSKPPWQRILIAFAGPFFNIALTVILFTAVYMIGVETPRYEKEPPVIGYVEKGSWGDKVGFQEGDKVLEINGKKVKTWEEFKKELLRGSLEKRDIKILVEREGKIITIPAKPVDIETGKETIGLQPHIEPVIGKVFKELPGGIPAPAYQVGLKEGDRIVSINGIPIKSWYDAVELIRKSEGKPLKIVVEREGKLIEKVIVPAIHPTTKLPAIGVSPKVETVKESYSFSEALTLAIQRTWELSVLTFKVLWGLITGEISFKTLGGPIAIAQFAGKAAESGLVPYLSSMAFISLQLGIFNLLPLPVLDGGLILLFLIEMIRRKPLPEKFKEYWQKVGFAIIISLMIFVLINDILRLIGQ